MVQEAGSPGSWLRAWRLKISREDPYALQIGEGEDVVPRRFNSVFLGVPVDREGDDFRRVSRGKTGAADPRTRFVPALRLKCDSHRPPMAGRWLLASFQASSRVCYLILLTPGNVLVQILIRHRSLLTGLCSPVSAHRSLLALANALPRKISSLLIYCFMPLLLLLLHLRRPCML